jgi:hypothetical protein
VAPYGVYDIGANTGWVNVGTDADTGQFAVERSAAGGPRWAPSAIPDRTSC